jgi:hypothetical protein
MTNNSIFKYSQIVILLLSIKLPILTVDCLFHLHLIYVLYLQLVFQISYIHMNKFFSACHLKLQVEFIGISKENEQIIFFF